MFDSENLGFGDTYIFYTEYGVNSSVLALSLKLSNVAPGS